MVNRNSRLGCSHPVMNRPSNACHEAMHQLQAIDFSMVDTILYLDAYPDSPEALAHYHKLHEERERLLGAMAADGCPPVSAMSVRDSSTWSWVDGPWPWDPEAN